MALVETSRCQFPQDPGEGLPISGMGRPMELVQRNLSNVQSIAIDEVLWQRGHKCLMVVYQIDTECKRLLWVGKDRTIKTLLRFFRTFGKERSALLVAGQALMGMFFVGELTKFVFRQPMNGLDAVLPVSLSSLPLSPFLPVLR